MLAFDFGINGETIIVSATGRLLNCQHRVRAFLESGLPFIDLLVAHGVPEEAFETIDSGSGRAASDALDLKGFRHHKTVESIVRLSLSYISGANAHAAAPTSTQIQAFAEQHREAVEEASDWGRSVEKKTRGSVFGAVLFLATATDARDSARACRARLFAEVLKTELGFTGERDPAYLLKNWLAEQTKRARKVGASGPSTETLFAAIAAAWTPFATGKSLRSLKPTGFGQGGGCVIAGFNPEAFADVPRMARTAASFDPARTVAAPVTATAPSGKVHGERLPEMIGGAG